MDAAPSGMGRSAAQSNTRARAFWRDLPVLAVLGIAVALLIKTFLFQAFYVDRTSMLPNLQPGDRVIVEKVSYRLSDPAPGDIVVFARVGAVAADSSPWANLVDAFRGLVGLPVGGELDYIKRVVAVEGDEIEARDGTVFVNDEPLEEPYLAGPTADFPESTVPAGSVFLLGDNRGNSEDSRSFGVIPESRIVGKAVVRIWPPSGLGAV